MGLFALLVLATLLPAHGPDVEAALVQAGANRPELERALEQLPKEERGDLELLLSQMPLGDLRSLSADFLVEHVHFAHRAWSEAAWAKTMPREVYFESVLPYASINERRDAWRRDFYERFQPLVAEARTASEAAALLNQKVFPLVKVRYSTARPKADQSPYESIEAGMASCTGLSVLLIDACRAVGVPARFVGIPSWSDDSGNHSWVEIWDDGWHFTGAAEPTGMELDQAWFTGRAAEALADSERYSIFAVSFRRTPQPFPMVWRPDSDQVFAVNVTARYTEQPAVTPEGFARVRLRVLRTESGRSGRQAVELTLTPRAGGEPVRVATKDERFDANDHAEVLLPLGATFDVTTESAYDDRSVRADFVVGADEQLVTLELLPAGGQLDVESRPDEPAAVVAAPGPGLDRATAERLGADLYQARAERLRVERKAEFEARVLAHGKHQMPVWYSVHGDAPAAGHSLYISMHGGGGAPAAVNDQQWENQKRLYQIDEGVYVAPRAPTNTWNLWHEAHIDDLFDRLIEDMVLFEGVDPDRVYLLGYSAGGDGVYQLAPRLADRFAAAAMMAGHPNDARPDGLCNLPFTVHVGAKDDGYERAAVATRWKGLLADLHAAYPAGYENWVELHAGKSHWMDREDAAALPWMAKHTRNSRPERIVWRQSSRLHERFYWLRVDESVAGSRLVVERRGQTIQVLEAEGVTRLSVRLDDSMLDLDAPVVFQQGESLLFEGLVPRSAAVLEATLAERGDPRGMWCAEVTVDLVPKGSD